MAYTQDERFIGIETPLGKDVLLLSSFSGQEGISRMFKFELELLSETESISFKDVVGKSVTLRVNLADGSPRYFNGYISRFAQSAHEEEFTSYRAEMVPWLWFLTRNADCRIFQEKTIPEIIKQVFSDRGFSDFKDSLQGSYDKREYCVQYRESDFDFVSRLMEEYGIFYFFEHEHGKHTLVLGDKPTAHKDCPGQKSARYRKVAGGFKDDDVVTDWLLEQELRTGKYSLNDYNFETPSSSLLASEPTVVQIGDNSKYELYDYPGEYLKKPEGSGLAKIRMQEVEADHLVARGASDCRAFTSGFKFTLEEHYLKSLNQSYVLTEIQHSADVSGTYGGGQGSATQAYANTFKCIPYSVPYRPPRVTPRPTVRGPQTALVTGKSGEEIWTDKYGRVKVQFYWDRYGKKDENSSCWMRVSHPWAGKSFGAVQIPRMGEEVVVDFMEGDPDRPLITGRVYNAEQTVPYTLPANQTQSGLKTRSSKGGGSANFNELRFEDKKGSEDIYFHAEKDFHRFVENNDDLQVGNNQTIKIKNNRTEEVTDGNEKVTIAKGNRDVTISMGNEALLIKMGNQSTKLDMGNQSTKLSLGKSETEALQSIELKVGQSSVKLDQMGVTIKGMMINVEGQVSTQVKGLMTTVNADAILTVKGGVTMIG